MIFRHKKTLSLKYILLAVSLLTAGLICGQSIQDTLFLNNETDLSLNKHLYYCKTEKPVNASYIRDSLKKDAFTKLYPQKSFSVGVTKYFYWLVFTVKNNSAAQNSFYFELNNPGLNAVTFYKYSNGQYQKLGMAGDKLPFRVRTLRYYDIVFPFKLAPGETATLFAFIDNNGDNVDCLPQLYDANTFNARQERYYLVIGTITGIMCAAFLLNLFLAFSLNDKLHLLYAFYIISILFEMYILQGVDLQYIYPDHPGLSDIFKYLSPAVSLTLMAYVMQIFLRQQRNNSRLRIPVDMVKYFIMALIPVSLIIHFYFDENREAKGIFQQVFALSMVLQLFLFFLSALEKAIQKFKPAYYYLAAIVYLWYGAIQYVITILGGNTKEQIEKQPNDLQIGIVVETILVFFGIIYRYNLYKNENRQLSDSLKNERIQFTEQMIQTQESERTRIATDLHDQLGGDLAAIKLSVQKLPLDKSSYSPIISMLDDASAEVRNISHNLMPPQFEKTKLEDLLRNYYVQLSNQTTTNFNFISVGPATQFNKNDELMIYRILMELTNNILKHAKATESTIQMIYGDTHLDIMAEDNGIGMGQKNETGIGLKNIKSRVDYMGGSMNTDSSSKGTTIIIQIPFKTIQHE